MMSKLSKLSKLALFATVTITTVACEPSGDKKETASSSAIHKGYSATADQYEVDGRVISNVDTTAPLWNPRGKSDELILERGKYLGEAYDLKRTDAQLSRAKKAQEKYSNAIYINSVMLGTVGMIKTPDEIFLNGIQRNFKAGASAVSVTAYAFSVDGPMPVMERLDRSINALKDKKEYMLVEGVTSIYQAKKEGKIAVIFNTQGAEYAIDDLSQLDEAHKRGVRVVNLIYNNDNAFAGGGSKQASGLSDLGKDFVKRANKLGVVMDCSHSSNQTCIDIANTSTKPMLASHSNPDALHTMNRNISDEAMKAIAATGGTVCNVGAGSFMNKQGDSSPEELINQILYTAKLIGKDKTCYATDYMHNATNFFLEGVRQVEVFAPEKGFGQPATNIATEHVWDIVAMLEQDHGWTEKEIRGFLGENLLRVYKANWK